MTENKQHLTPEQVAQCVELQDAGKYDQIPAEIRQHLSECDECAIEVMSVREIQEDLRKEKNKKKTNLIFIFSAVAASFIMIFVIANVFFNEKPLDIKQSSQTAINQKKTNTPETINQDKTISDSGIQEQKPQTNNLEKRPVKKIKKARKKNHEKTLLASFTPNAELEKLVNRSQEGYYRGENTKPTNKLIHYPEKKQIIWSNSTLEELTLEVYNNKGEMIHSATKNDSVFQLPLLEKGLYYWKVINEDFDLLYVGKIKAESK